MKEMMPGERLTVGEHSSTLNRDPAKRENIPMPEPPTESLPTRTEITSRNPGLPGRAEAGSFEELFRQHPQAAREAASAIMNAAREQGRELSEEEVRLLRQTGFTLSGGADVPENGDREQEVRSNTGRLGSVTGSESLGKELNNTLKLVNRDIEHGIIKSGDENSLQSLRDYIRTFKEVLAKQDDSEVGFSALNQLHEIENKLVDSIVESGRGSERDKAQSRLYGESTRFEQKYNSLEDAIRRGEQVNPEEMARYLGEKQALVDRIKEEIEAEETPSLEAGRFPAALMNAALKFRETRELLINEIMFKPYEDVTEQGHYEINFYASGTLDELLAAMSKMAGRSEDDRKFYQKYKGIKTTARNFWEMNRGLWTGNLETFSRIAEEMNYEQFDLMKDLPGVGTVMRLYDQKLYEELGKSGRITAEGFDRVKREVEKSFRSLNGDGAITSAYYEERDGTEEEKKRLHEWEIARALSVGRVYYNITFRSAEVIAMSRINLGSGGKAYTSFPLENAARIMSFILTAERFGVGVEKGGMELFNNAREANKELMADDKRHLGKNRFTHINGVSVDDLEFLASTGISGIFSGWRMFYAAYPLYKFNLYEDGQHQEMSLEHIMDERLMIYKDKKVKGLMAYINEGIKKDAALSMSQKQDAIVDALSFLIGDNGKMNTGLGMFLRLAQGNAGMGGLLSGEVGFKARKQIWKRIAETNPLAAINILTGLSEGDKDEYGNLVESHKSLRNILKTQGWITAEEAEIDDPNNENYYQNSEKWRNLKNKLQLAQEISVRKQVDPSFRGNAPELEAHEKLLLEVIKNTVAGDLNGKTMTEDLADIIFPYMTFMNDISYEDLKWSNVGSQFFKRRFGDIGSYNSAISKGIFPLLGNVGGMKPEDVIGAFSELFKGIEGPNGEHSGWNAALPWELAYLQMAMTYGGPDSWAPIRDIKMAMKKETSRLQHYAGPHAPALSKEQAYNFLHLMRHHGVVGHHTEELIKKKRRITLGELLLSIIADMFPLFVLDMTVGAFKAPVSASAK